MIGSKVTEIVSNLWHLVRIFQIIKLFNVESHKEVSLTIANGIAFILYINDIVNMQF